MDEGVVEGGEDACDAKDELACIDIPMSVVPRGDHVSDVCQPSRT